MTTASTWLLINYIPPHAFFCFRGPVIPIAINETLLPSDLDLEDSHLHPYLNPKLHMLWLKNSDGKGGDRRRYFL